MYTLLSDAVLLFGGNKQFTVCAFLVKSVKKEVTLSFGLNNSNCWKRVCFDALALPQALLMRIRHEIQLLWFTGMTLMTADN